MKQFIAPTYTFTPGTSGVGTIDLSGISSFNIKYLVSIINQSTGQIIYATGSNDFKYTNVSGTIVTLFYDTSSMNAGDTLQVIYESQEYQPSLAGFIDVDGSIGNAKLTENKALAIGNAVKKFRDGFADLDQGASPDSLIWDVVWNSQGSSSLGRAGNAQGSSYMKISMCPITVNSELVMTTKKSFKFPMRFINMLSLSQRIVGQEFQVSIIGVNESGIVEVLTPKVDLNISGSITIASNVATINFVNSHGLQTSDRVILLNNTEKRLNVGPVQVTVITDKQITVPCTLANATYTAGGIVRWADPIGYVKNGAGLLHESTAATTATFITRRNGFNTRLLNSTISTTANATTVNFADPFNATSMNTFIVNQEELTVIPRSPDNSNGPSTPLKYHQGLPDEELEYKICIRAKNLSNMTRPIARITAIAKTGTTTATVTTNIAHGLATTDFVQIYGVRDITNFPNLVASTQVASIVNSTQFTIIIGSAVTASSAGGTVFINQGSVLAPGISAINVQSLSRTDNILTLVGNTTWVGYLPGETIHLYGCDATSIGLYDGAYKVLRINTTSLQLESVGANFGTINCGGAVMRRTDLRLHAISELEHTRHIVELSNAQGSLDASRSLPVVGTLTTVTTVGSVTSSNTAIPGIIADVASAALTTTTTTAALTPTFGATYKVTIPVTAVTGTTPTMDVAIEESSDSGTNWYKVYDFPRITATGFYQSPTIPLTGNRVRYVQTIGGTTPSFTRTINRLQSSWVSADRVRQSFDRTISLTTLNSTTPSLFVDGTTSVQLVINIGTAATPPSVQLQGSEDNINFYSVGTPLAAVASSTVRVVVTDTASKFVRAMVTTAGTTVVPGYVLIKAF